MEENKNEVVETTEETKVEETKTEEVKKEDSESAKEIEHLKKLLSKANSEAADYKKQLRSKMSEDEVKAAENEALLKELEEYKTEKKVAEASKGLMTWGLDSAKADEMAKALVEGDITSFLAGGKEYFETVSQKAIADAMDKQKLSVGKTPEKADVDKTKDIELRKTMGLPIDNK
jgi:chromosome segregation ATPase